MSPIWRLRILASTFVRSAPFAAFTGAMTRNIIPGPAPDLARQAVASVASGDRTSRPRELDVPAFVIHGLADTLCDVSGGRATAAAVPGAELVLIDGMGHNLRPASGNVSPITSPRLCNVAKRRAREEGGDRKCVASEARTAQQDRRALTSPGRSSFWCRSSVAGTEDQATAVVEGGEPEPPEYRLPRG